MKKIISVLSLAGLVLLPACCCKKDDMKKDKSGQMAPKKCEKKDMSKKDMKKQPAKGKQDAKKTAKDSKDVKKKYSLVNPAVSKAQRAQFEEVPQLPLV